MPPRKRGTAPMSTKAASAKGDQRKVDDLFLSYRDQEETEEVIGPEGIIQFCKDLGIDPQDRKTLLLAWKMGAQRQGFFSKSEFKSGFSRMGATSLAALKKALPALEAEVCDPRAFEHFYAFAFDFCLTEPGQKIIDVDTAAAMLAIVLPDGCFTAAFSEFLREQTEYKKVNRDQWSLFLRFSREVRSDLGNYDDNPSWPVLLDNFVDWSKARAEQGAGAATAAKQADQPATRASPKAKGASPPAQKGRGRKRAHGH